MSIINIIGLLIELARIYLYMRCFDTCLTKYRIDKRMITITFAVLWGISGFIRLSVPSHIIIESTPAIYVIELLFLFVISFFYQCKMSWRVLVVFLLPTIYWIEKWVIIFAIFQTMLLNDIQHLIGSVFSLLVLCILELAIERVRKSKQEQERELLEQEISMYQNQFHIIQQSQEHIRALKHDMKHHIKMLSDLIADGENDVALKYLKDMGAFMANSQEYVSSGNERIDSILNYMISKAKKENININWNIQIPEKLSIETFDINVILSNLFDNAFRALCYITSPKLSILMKYDRNVLHIDICNNYNRIESEKTSSSDFLEHGYGLKNVRRIAEKYHGDLTITDDGITFNASVILFL